MSFINIEGRTGIFKPKRRPSSGKPRGRKKGWRKPGGVFTTIRIDEELKAILEIEGKQDERRNDTMKRLLKEKGEKIKSLVQENDRLKALIERLKTEQGVIIPE
ncbi:MAG TPA: hypothetical protein VFS97_11910 [Nitrososphaeraceae archaeon]|nr:hypothetical protein [Nitrososphaeraceae archaeon]